MRDSVVSDNRVASVTLTTEDVGPAGTVLEGHGGGTLTNVRVVDNVTSIAATEVASATGAIAVYNFSDDPQLLRFVDSVISGNKALASSASGTATAQGAGIFNNGLLELRRTVVSDNLGKASAPGGVAEGGGIWNGVLVTGPPVELTLVDSLVARNSLLGGSGIQRRGGGLFTTEPVTLTRSRLAGNAPDQCFGCSP
jgi:putative intracellular protease/amidase